MQNRRDGVGGVVHVSSCVLQKAKAYSSVAGPMRIRRFGRRGMWPICKRPAICRFTFGRSVEAAALPRVTLLGIPQNLSHEAITQTAKSVILRARELIFYMLALGSSLSN